MSEEFKPNVQDKLMDSIEQTPVSISIKKEHRNFAFNPNLKILERFGIAFMENTHMKKTQMHLVSRIRWDSFMKYLNWLLNNNYIECEERSNEVRYNPTEKGREMFLRLLQFVECM